jgi:hypothetical protein
VTAETEERIIEQLATIAEQLKHFATKEDLEQLRTEMHKEIGGMLKWTIILLAPTWIGILGTLVGVIALLLKH